MPGINIIMKRIALILLGIMLLGLLSSCKTNSYKYKPPKAKKQKKNCNCPKFTTSGVDPGKTYIVKAS